MFKSRKQLVSRAVAASLAAGFAAFVAVAAQQAGHTRTSTAPNKIITIEAAREVIPRSRSDIHLVY